MHACIHTYIHTYMHACIHTYIHTHKYGCYAVDAISKYAVLWEKCSNVLQAPLPRKSNAPQSSPSHPHNCSKLVRDQVAVLFYALVAKWRWSNSKPLLNSRFSQRCMSRSLFFACFPSAPKEASILLASFPKPSCWNTRHTLAAAAIERLPSPIIDISPTAALACSHDSNRLLLRLHTVMLHTYTCVTWLPYVYH
jgi:hypothetical protein